MCRWAKVSVGAKALEERATIFEVSGAARIGRRKIAKVERIAYCCGNTSEIGRAHV